MLNNINKNTLLLFLLDIALIMSASLLSVILRFDFSIPEKFLTHLNMLKLTLIIMIKVSSFAMFSLYNGFWRYTSIWDVLNVIKANIFASFLIISIVYFTLGFNEIGRSIFLIDLILCTAFIGILRLGIRLFFSHFLNALRPDFKGANVKKIILIGAGDTGQTIIRQIQHKKYESMLEVVALLDDDETKIGSRLRGIPIVGKIKNIGILDIDYDEIYISIPSASANQMRDIINFCKFANKPFKTLPSISKVIEGDISVSHFRDVSILDLLGREEVDLDKSSIRRLIVGKRILITGAGGSIGSELVRQCLNYNPSVLVMVDYSEFNLFDIDREIHKKSPNTLLKPILCDIRDEFLIDKIFEEYEPQIVFHAAAYKHVPIQEVHPWEAIKTNIFGTHNLAKSSAKYKIDKFVLVSTDKAVRPANVMGATKRIAEIICQYFNHKPNQTAFMSVRFGNVLGSSGSVIPIFKQQIKEGGPVTITDPEMERYFMSIPEASQLILQAGSLGIGGEIFILDMGNPIKIIDLAYDLIRLSGFTSDEIPIKITGARPGEKKKEELSNSSEKMDKTKHEKIFVLGNKETNYSYASSVISNFNSLEKEIKGRDPIKIRRILSTILDDYQPEDGYKHRSAFKSNSAEA